jgi:hypothetical protein
MKQYCENPLCEDRSVKEVPVSVLKPGDQKRALCSACEEVYWWGVQHGKATPQKREVWVLCVSDRGLIVHAKAFNSKNKAEEALFEYLRCYENYEGPDEISEACDWLAQHDERLSVTLCSTPVDPT